VIRVLLVTKGHPFARDAFFAVFDANPEISWTHVEHPAAPRLLAPANADLYDVVVAYDMPGIHFLRGEVPVAFEPPDTATTEGLHHLLEAGTHGFVMLHHAIAGWPAWPEYAEIVGGRFHYQPAELRGTRFADSGYRHGVTHTVTVLDPTHPVTAELPASFAITDEVYCCPVFEDDVEPLLRSDLVTASDQFFSADLAIRGTRSSNEGWTHPPASSLVGWAKHAGQSPLVYLQFGDGPDTYADANYRTVVAGAIRWAASPAARDWARERRARRGSFA
jgi:type 1 glutamine amidotransferase